MINFAHTQNLSKKKNKSRGEPPLPFLCQLTRLFLSVLFWAQKNTKKCGAQGTIKYTFRAGIYNSRRFPALKQIKRLLRPKAYFISGSKGPQNNNGKKRKPFPLVSLLWLLWSLFPLLLLPWPWPLLLPFNRPFCPVFKKRFKRIRNFICLSAGTARVVKFSV